MFRVKDDGAEKGLPGSVHIVESASAVLVNVDKAGGDVEAGKVENFVSGVVAGVPGSDPFDPSAFAADLSVWKDGVPKDEVSDEFPFPGGFRISRVSYGSHCSIRTTAVAAIPSSLPVNPSPSSVVALTLTRHAEIPAASAIAFRMRSI